MKRPLAWVTLLYAGGVLLAEDFRLPLAWLFPASLVLVLAALASSRLRGRLLWALLVLAGGTNLTWHTAVIAPDDLRRSENGAAELVALRGTLTDTPSRRIYLRGEVESWRTSARVQLVGLKRQDRWMPASGTVVATVQGLLPEHYFAGQNVELIGVLSSPPPPLAAGLFDFRAYLERQQIYFQLKTDSSNDWRLIPPIRNAAPLADRFREWGRKALALGLPGEDESLQLERALTLGDKEVLTEKVAEPFVQAATYHIFAVDGLRMAIIFGIFFSLLRVFGLPRAGCGVALLPMIWFYTALTGWPASAIRASVMLSVVIGGWMLKRPSDLLNSLFAAALILLAWDPQQLFQAGFQLSFVVVFCMILMMPAFEGFGHWLLRSDPLLPESLRPKWRTYLEPPARYLLDLGFVSIAAWLGSIPLVAYYFHIFTPVSGPANVVAVPLCALVLASNFISLLLASWFPQGAEIFNHAGWFLMECIRVSSQWFAQWPAAYRYVEAPGLFSTALYYAVLIALFTGWLFRPRWRSWKVSGLMLLCTLWFGLWLNGRAAVRLTVLPLSGGSAVYVDAPGSQNDLLVDCGNSNAVEHVMKPWLRAQGVNALPHFAMTHGDARHIGGVQLLAELFPVGEVTTSAASFRSPAYRAALAHFTSRRQTAGRGDLVAGWTVMHPEDGRFLREADDNALVLRGEFAGTRVLLLSDLGRQGQRALLEDPAAVRGDIVIACLPETSEPLEDDLLDAIQPRLIIVADSEIPANKRASPELLERLERRGVPVLSTRVTGAVDIELRRNRWRAVAQTRDISQ